MESFFVISAFFLVRKQWRNETLDVKQQFKHRIVRLYPPYLAVLIIAVLYALLKKTIPYDIVPHLLSAQNFQWMITGYSSAMQPMTAHTWTLSIEMWGGLIWLLLLRHMPKKQFRIVMCGMLIISDLYRTLTIIFGLNVWIVSLCPLAHFDAFACGSLLAIGVREKKVTKRIGALSVVGLAGIIACVGYIAANNHASFIQGYQLLSLSKNYLNNWFTGNIYIFISLLTTGIIGLLLLYDEKRTKYVGKIEKWFIDLGDISYLVYLFHWPILIVLRRLVSNWAVTFATVLVTSILAAFFFNKLYSLVYKKLLEGK